MRIQERVIKKEKEYGGLNSTESETRGRML